MCVWGGLAACLPNLDPPAFSPSVCRKAAMLSFTVKKKEKDEDRRE